MVDSDKAFSGSANLDFWFKVRGGDELMLSDIPEIISLRWTYFRDNWEFIKFGILKRTNSYFDPDFLNSQIDEFSDFITKQRYASKQINPFSDGLIFHKYYAIFDNVAIENINLTNEESQIIDNKVRETLAYSKNDFLYIKKQLTDYRDRVADTGGLSDTSYNAVYNKSSIPSQTSATIVDGNLMATLQENIKSVDFVLANLFAVDAAVDPFAIARANANNPDIEIGNYRSGRLVKLNYKEDLQGLATRQMGSPDKWIDIAIANGLKPPYIDEVGQRLNLLSNGSNNLINISRTDLSGNLNIDKFYINQVILLQSNVQVFSEQRTIISIRSIPISGEILLELDGAADLSKYKIAEQANIRVFKPNTVNSSFFVLIPSNEPLDDSRQEEEPWFLAKSAADEKRAKIDLAIDDNGDINFNTNGDLKLSYGLANAIQAIKLKMITELGTLRYHPDYGLVNIVGGQNSNLADLKSKLTDNISKQIAADSRFDRIESLIVEYLVKDKSNTAASAIGITLSVRLAGGTTVIPISFTVAK